MIKEYILDEICELITCGVAKRPEYVDTGIPFLSSKNVKANRFILDHYNYVSVKTHNELTKKNKPKKGDILYTRVGSFGEAAVIDFDFDFSIFVSLTLIKPKKNLVNAYYLMYFLNSEIVQDLAKKSTTGSGVQNLNVNTVREFKILLPPLQDQIRIANILSKAEALISQRKESLRLLDEFLKSTFLEMFIDEEKFVEWGGLFTINDLVEQDKHAIKAGPFGSALKKEVYVEKGYKIYGQEQVIADDLSYGDYYIDEDLYRQLESCKIKAGDILISLVGTYGKVSIVPEIFEPGIINPRLMKISFDKKKVLPVYFKFLLQSVFILKQTKRLSRGGTMDILNVGIVKELKIPKPPIEVQNKFAHIVARIQALRANYQTSLQELENLYGSLSQRAFKGELNKGLQEFVT